MPKKPTRKTKAKKTKTKMTPQCRDHEVRLAALEQLLARTTDPVEKQSLLKKIQRVTVAILKGCAHAKTAYYVASGGRNLMKNVVTHGASGLKALGILR
jgi:hypothetical protein